jgi:hypothetical protein
LPTTYLIIRRPSFLPTRCRRDSAPTGDLGRRALRKDHAEHARVTAICVNLALDGVEQDIRQELSRTTGETANALQRVLAKLKERRIDGDELKSAGNC